MKGFLHYALIGFVVVTSKALPNNNRPQLSKDEIAVFSQSTLQRMLQDRSVECIECVEKSDFIEKVFETQTLPIIKKKIGSKKKTPQDEANIAEVLADLKMRGFGDVEVQRPHANMNGVEDLISEAFAAKTREAVTKKASKKRGSSKRK